MNFGAALAGAREPSRSNRRWVSNDTKEQQWETNLALRSTFLMHIDN